MCPLIWRAVIFLLSCRFIKSPPQWCVTKVEERISFGISCHFLESFWNHWNLSRILEILESHPNPWNLCRIFSTFDHWNHNGILQSAWNFGIFEISGIFGILSESVEFHQNLWNLWKLLIILPRYHLWNPYEIFGIFLGPYQNLRNLFGIFRILSESLKS